MTFLRSYYNFLIRRAALGVGFLSVSAGFLIVSVATILGITHENKLEVYINSCPYSQGDMVVIDLTGMSARVREVRFPGDIELRNRGECVYKVFNGHEEFLAFEPELRSY